MELRSDLIDFKYLFKLVKIELEQLTFKKYSITRTSTLSTKVGYENINLDKEEGIETHVATANVVTELAGQVGLLIKGFTVKIPTKRSKRVVINNIIYIEPKQVNQSVTFESKEITKEYINQKTGQITEQLNEFCKQREK